MSDKIPEATQEDGDEWPPFNPRLEAIRSRDGRRLTDPPRSFREWLRGWIRAYGPYRPERRYRN